MQSISKNGFYPPEKLCGPIVFTAEHFYFDGPGRVEVGPLRDGMAVTFNEKGTFSIESNDHNLFGMHELRIHASLEEHP